MFMIGFILYGTVVLLPILLQTVIGFTAVQQRADAIAWRHGGADRFAHRRKNSGEDRPAPPHFYGLDHTCDRRAAAFARQHWAAHMRVPAADWIISRIGTSFLFVPVNVMAFGNVPRDKTNQASGLLNLSRNIGGSMGISFVTTMLYRRGQHHLQGSAEAPPRYPPWEKVPCRPAPRTRRRHGADLSLPGVWNATP